jgi:hypothetical protein
MYFFIIFFSLFLLSLSIYFIFTEREEFFLLEERREKKSIEKEDIPLNVTNSKIDKDIQCGLMELSDQAKIVNKDYNAQIICGRVQEVFKDKEGSLKEILLLIEMSYFFKNSFSLFISKKFLITPKTDFRGESFSKKTKNFDPREIKIGNSVCVSIEGEIREIMRVQRYNLLWVHKFKSFKKGLKLSSILQNKNYISR